MAKRYQKSKRARSEEKLLRQLRHLGFTENIKHFTSHVSGGRSMAKDRWHSEIDKHNRMMNLIIERA